MEQQVAAVHLEHSHMMVKHNLTQGPIEFKQLPV